MEEEVSYSMQEHSFTAKSAHWSTCSRCGLVRLKNPLTEWCVKKGCYYDEHPSFKTVVRQYTKKGAW